MDKFEQTNVEFEQAVAECRALFQKKLHYFGASWLILRPTALTDQRTWLAAFHGIKNTWTLLSTHKPPPKIAMLKPSSKKQGKQTTETSP